MMEGMGFTFFHADFSAKERIFVGGATRSETGIVIVNQMFSMVCGLEISRRRVL